MDKWLVFDAMGVIFAAGDDTKDLLVPYIRRLKPGVGEAQINGLYREASLGRISSRAFWEALGFEDWQAAERDYLDTSIVIDQAFIETAKKLSARYKLAMLSNDVGEWSAYLRRRFGLDRLFAACVISGDVGCRKPDEMIYKALLQKINAPAENCVFFDDRPKNLEAARRAGMNAVLFNRGGNGPGGFDPEGYDYVNNFEEIEAMYAAPLGVRLVKPCVGLKEQYLDMLAEWDASGEMRAPWVLNQDCTDFGKMTAEFELMSRGIGVKEGFVPSSTYWLVRDDDKVLGAVNIRHALNDRLRNAGGHIGYGVRPGERRKGYAKEMLRLALLVAKGMGLDRVLLTCDKDNIASARTMLGNGGILDSEGIHEGKTIQRYRIGLNGENNGSF